MLQATRCMLAFALLGAHTQGVTAMLSMKRFTVGHGGVRTLLQNRNFSPIRGSAVMMSSAAGAEPTAKKGKGKKKEGDSKYAETILLPVTSFDQRANSLKREPEIQKWWADNKIYENLAEKNIGDKFTLHDGPPYANGNLHIGHALNKILKDIINRYQILQGRKVRFVPGWDCHGLPIELKVLQSMKTKEREALTPIALRKRAAVFAKEAIDSQRDSFKRYGVWGDWDTPYATLQPVYEAAQIKVFGQMVTKGHIYRGKKPVHWSPSSRTALAEAELEYPENHVSKSIYVGFKITSASPALQAVLDKSNIDSSSARVAIWTTTPWTIPANLAVAVNSELDYCLAVHPAVLSGSPFIIATALAGTLEKKFGVSAGEGEAAKFSILGEFKGADIAGTQYQHPFYERKSEIVIGGDYITTESGTGLVHTAPGHGQEDYLTGLKYGLPLLSPVNDMGCFTEEAGERFVGKDVLGDGNTDVIAALGEAGVLIKEEAYPHKYPYDWRTKKPTIFRATEQWFASVGTFRENALEAIDKVTWIPAVGRNRITAMTESRGDWCISRQRSWGVPIPVFYKKSTNEALMNAEILEHVEGLFREKGSDCWWELDIKELMPEGPLRDSADEYTKGTDTMDVWFDSGTSWAGVANTRDELSYPADVYLEGSDQHRGWFQSSLLTSVASMGVAPYKTVLTHGFVLDEKGYKMSKSLGNVVDPLSVIEGGGNQKENPAYGADTLRLWVSGVDYSSDVCLGDGIIKQVSESYRKLRNTLRYLLGSLSDFDPTVHTVPYDKLADIDKYMLGKLTETVKEVETAYTEYQFYKANQAITTFANTDLSAFYLDIAKERLYISAKNDPNRRSCQTVLQIMVEQISVMMSPIVPHMAEDAWQNLPYKEKPNKESVFDKGWITKSDRFPSFDAVKWDRLRSLRGDVNGCIELARAAKLVGASQECQVVIFPESVLLPSERIVKGSDPVYTDLENQAFIADLKKMKGDDMFLSQHVSTNGVDDLRSILITSQISIVSSMEELVASCPDFNLKAKDSVSGVVIGVKRAKGTKCDRCWFYSENVGADPEPTFSDICLKCSTIVRQYKDLKDLKFDTPPPVADALPLA